MNEPRTEAGRELWGRWATEAMEASRWRFYLDSILAIEREAAARAASRETEALELVDDLIDYIHAGMSDSEWEGLQDRVRSLAVARPAGIDPLDHLWDEHGCRCPEIWDDARPAARAALDAERCSGIVCIADCDRHSFIGELYCGAHGGPPEYESDRLAAEKERP